MDGLHDDHPSAYPFLLWDRLEEAVSERPGAIVLAVLTLTILIILQSWLDILAILTLVSRTKGTGSAAFAGIGNFALVGACILLSARATRLIRSLRPAEHKVSSDAVLTQPPATGRFANFAERELEEVFKCYLEHLVVNSSSAISVDYIPCGTLTEQHTTFRSPFARPGGMTTAFKVLNPEFYTRFVFYAHDSEAIFSELTESKTIWLDRPDLLPDIFLKKGSPPLYAQGIVDYVYFELIRSLRRRSRALTQSSRLASAGARSVSDVRSFRISSMDAYMLSQPDDRLRRTYRSTVTKIFIADRYLGGIEWAFDLVLFALRLLLWWGVVAILTNTFIFT